MCKGTTNSGIPVFGEIVKLLDKQEINSIAAEKKANRYTKRLDAYQHLIIMLYAALRQFESLRDLETGFLSSATRMNHFGLNYMVRRSTLSDANARRTPEFFEAVYNALYERFTWLLADSRPVKGIKGLPPDESPDQPTLFSEMRGPNFENQKTMSYLQHVNK